jgi:hypothetical protein
MSEHDVSVTEQTANMSLSIFPETPPWQYARLEDPSVADFEYHAAKLEQSHRVEQSYRDEATESDKKVFKTYHFYYLQNLDHESL